MPIEGYFPTNFDRLTEIERQSLLYHMGLLDPVHVQLFNFLSQVLTEFDFGVSIRYMVNFPIMEIVKQKAPMSLQFGLTALAIGIPIGWALGIMMARKKGGGWDRGGTFYIALMNSVPAAVYIILIQLYGSTLLGVPMLFNPEVPATRILPIFSLCLPIIAANAFWMRRFMVDEINKDYIKLAYAKGVPNTEIFFRHVFRNAVVPMTNTIPAAILFTIVGSIFVEGFFSIPGTGGLLIDVIRRQDNPMVQALVIIYSSLGVFGLLLGDLLMAFVDPRIKLHKKGDQR
jgi:oligopeptide transport system permease protein